MLDDIFFTVVFFESLASQGFEKNSSQNALLVAFSVVIVYQCPPWKALAVDNGNDYHLLQDVDGG
jgi:hypothetical protein